MSRQASTGFIADTGNSLEWLFEAEARATKDATVAREERFRQFFTATGAMTMGAATYEWAVGHEDLLTSPARWREYYGQVLLDEIILTVAPVTLGAGARLLPRRLTAAQLALTDCSHDGTFASFTYALA